VKRIGILQIWQESNHFNPVLTTKMDFEAFAMGMGNEGLGEFSKGEEVGGFVAGLNSWDEPVEPVGLLFAQAWPGGPITTDTKKFSGRTIVDQIDCTDRLDGILFSLHGALTSEDDPDVDGFLLKKLRDRVGYEIPIVASIDLHSHLTLKMTKMADALVAYHTNPHIDRFRTGQHAAALLEKILSGVKPRISVIRLPMLTCGEAMNTTGPVLSSVFQQVKTIESYPDVLSAAVLMTNPCLDTPELGWTICIFTDGKQNRADKFADELARMCWESRLKLSIELLGPEESVDAALACKGSPVIIADGADATNSGACGDSIHLLKEMLKHKIPEGALTIMVDPQAVAHAAGIGAGGQFEYSVGGKRDTLFSKPLFVSGKVISVQSAKYVLSGHLADNMQIDMGNSAIIQLGNVTLLLVERPGPGSSPMMYRCV